METADPSVSQPRAGARLTLLLTGFVTAILYYLIAWANISAIARAILDGVFYRQSDFGIVIWSAGRDLRAGDVIGLYDSHWLYPPSAALPIMAASLLPLAWGFWVWIVGTNLVAALLMRCARLRWRDIAVGLAGPASYYNLLLGQNGALTCGLMIATLLLMRPRPGSAGMLAGLLCIKPQIGLLIPVVLLRNWRAVLPCAITAMALITISTAITGLRGWVLFFRVAQPIAQFELNVPFGQTFQLASTTVFAAARSLGCGVPAAWAIQAAGSAAACGAAWVLWGKSDADNIARMAASICLTMLAVPYGFTYDLIAFSVAIAALSRRAHAAQMPVFAALWLCPALSILIAARLHVEVMPMAAIAGLVLAWGQLDFDPARAIR